MTDLTTFLAGTTLPELLESRGLEDPVAFITRFESSFLSMLGFPRMDLITANFHKWAEDKLNPDSGTVNGAQTAGDTNIELGAGEGNRFRTGDVVQVDGSRELILVTTAIANALSVVVRGIRGTTPEAMVNGDIITVQNNPNTEQGTAKTARPTELTQVNNFTELFDDTASVSKKMRRTESIGNVGDQLDHQVLRVTEDLIRRIAKTVINGRRQDTNPEGTTSSTNPSTMDGIIQLILTGTDSVTIDALGGGLTEDLLNQGMEDSWTRGGTPTLIATGSRQMRAISKLMEGRVRFDVESTTLGVVVQRFVSPVGGIVDVMEADKHMPKDVVLVLDRARLGLKMIGEGDPFLVEDLSKTGHVDNRLVSVELTLEAKNTTDGGHVLIQNLSAA